MSRKRTRRLPEQPAELVMVWGQPRDGRLGVRLALRGPWYWLDADQARSLAAMLTCHAEEIDAYPPSLKRGDHVRARQGNHPPLRQEPHRGR